MAAASTEPGSDGLVHLIRHGKAGSRSAWDDDDALRPLSAKGIRQAEALADQLAQQGSGRVVSSPAVRCRQTVLPLADRLGLAVEDAAELAEGRPLAPLLDLLHSVPPGTALCAHGDLVPMAIRSLTAAGMDIDADPISQKGSVWSLERRAGGFVVGRYSPPP